MMPSSFVSRISMSRKVSADRHVTQGRYDAAMRYLTRGQVRNVDRIAIDRYGVPGIVLMENAAIGATRVARAMLRRRRRLGQGDTTLILCGGGNNGGDGLAIARHLHNAGHPVLVALTIDPSKYTGDALINHRIARSLDLPTIPFTLDTLTRDHALIVDAIFGTGLSQPPRELFPTLAAVVNESGIPVLSIDLPSGLDCDGGLPLGPVAIRATRTVTFVARKAGFANPASREYTGVVSVASIGVPDEVVQAAITDAAADASRTPPPGAGST
jgi:NAD(P)H-hydrate epimerase